MLVSLYQRYGAGEWMETPLFRTTQEDSPLLEKMSVVIDSLFFRGIEALALLLNSLPFPVLRGSSSPGLSTIGLGSLVVEIPKFVSGTRSLDFVFPLCFCQVELLELPHAQPSYSLIFP